MFDRVTSDYVYLRPIGDAVSAPEESDVDKIETFRLSVKSLQDAQDTLYEMADSQGRTINRVRAAKCRIAANQCASALEGLQKVAEL
jgi:hypothetical protein